MTILVLTTRLFGTPSSGGEVCTARLLTALREAGHDIVLAGRGDAAAAGIWTYQVLSLGDTVGPFEQLSERQKLAVVSAALLSGRSVTVNRQRVRLLADRVADLLRRRDAVIVYHLQAWPWLRGASSRPVLLVNHNVESDNHMRRSRVAMVNRDAPAVGQCLNHLVLRRGALRLRELQLEAMHRSEVVAYLSEGDCERMRVLARLAGHESRTGLAVLAGYPLTPRLRHRVRQDGGRHWSECRAPGPGRQIGKVFAGLCSVSAPWSRDGCNSCWRGAVSKASRCRRKCGPWAGFGTLPTSTIWWMWWQWSSLSGSGVQEQAIEAIGLGPAVVASRHALRGLLDDLPPQVRIEDDASGFAQACIEAGQSLGTRPRDALGAWVQARRQAYGRSLLACLVALGVGAPRPAAAQSPDLVAAR